MKKLLFTLGILFLMYSNACGHPPSGDCTKDCKFTGTLTAAGDIAFSGDGNGLLYGEIYAIDAASNTVVDADLRETPITAFAVNGESNGVTASHTSDILTFPTAGKYMVNVSMSMAGSGAAQVVHIITRKNHGISEGANSKFISNVCTAAGDDCPTDDTMYATHAFSNGDRVYSTVTEMGMTVNVEYDICNVTGTTAFQLDSTLLCGGDCSSCASAVNLTEDLTPTGKLVHIGTTLDNVHAHRTLAATTAKGSITLSGIIDMSANDTLGLFMHTDDSTARTNTVDDITLTAIQIGG